MSSKGGKNRNPGFIPGEHWNECLVCGFVYRQRDMRRRWDGAIVCKWDWEPRHPQDFLRARPEDQSPKGLHRSESEDTFVDVAACRGTDVNGVAGVGTAGCAIAGLTAQADNTIPQGTF